MLVPALRRFVSILLLIGVPTVVVSLVLGLLLNASLARSIAIGFYLVGSTLLIGGFFVGNRGPVRPMRDVDGGEAQPRLANRRMRWATRQENEETINLSAVFVALGFVLLVLGIASDNRHSLF